MTQREQSKGTRQAQGLRGRWRIEPPFNAEAPPEALAGDITPTELHYVRSNFAVPTHDGTLEIGGAVESSTTLGYGNNAVEVLYVDVR
jgi:hypothetical protein